LDPLRAAIDKDRNRLCDELDMQPDGKRWFCPKCQRDPRRHADGDFSTEAGFRCHKGGCGWSGDGFDLVRLVRGCDFPTGVAFVRKVYGIPAGTGPAVAPLPPPPKTVKVYLDHDAAAKAAHRAVCADNTQDWKETRRDFYCDASGRNVAAVLRFDGTNKDGKPAKSYRPIHAVAGGWAMGDPPGKWPLFKLPEIMSSSGPVYVCEGEKAASAGLAIGLTCTTSAHGAQSPKKTDWGPLAGRDVVILPDNDDAGSRYADAVVEIVRAVGVRSVRIVKLPQLPPKGDLFDFVEQQAGKPHEEVRSAVEALATVEAEATAQTEHQEDLGGGARPYSTRSWGEIISLDLPPPDWFWGACFALGYGRVRVQVIFGQGGLGKSRISMNLARNQVLGLPFGGMTTGTRPLRHLFMGTENGIHRLQYDIQRMSEGLTDDQKAALDNYVFLATLEAPDDGFVMLADEDNRARWRDTVEKRRPDVLWVDPWGDVQAGDANADADARWTLTELARILGAINPGAALVILAHARTGAKNIMEALGYAAANFGKGSKALFSSARCVFNLAPGSEVENPPVLVACAKSNDGRRPAPFALVLDTETMTYSVDPDFDADAWAADILDLANGKKRAKSKPQRLSETEALAMLGSETDTKTGIMQRLKDKGLTRDDAYDLVQRLVSSHKWEQWRQPGKNMPTYIGTGLAVKARMAQWGKDNQPELPAA
jgi:hypothetical protein